MSYTNRERIQEKFIERSKELFGDKFIYDRVLFTHGHNDVELLCDLCGWIRVTPSKHVKLRTGCPRCDRCKTERRRQLGVSRKRYTPEELREKCIKTHGCKYSYEISKFCTSKTKIEILCPDHGVFEQRTSDHYKGNGCVKCLHESLRDSQDDFIKKVIERHGDKYSFEYTVYKGQDHNVTATCPLHGPFTIRADNFAHRYGCQSCSGQNYKESPSVLYIFQYEDYLKIGITCQDIRKRLQPLRRSSGLDFTHLASFELHSWAASKEAETMALTYLKNRYDQPNFSFDGHTETFINVNVAELMEYIKRHIMVFF